MFNGGNVFSHLMFLVWLPLGVLIAATMPRQKAFMIIVIGGILFLPQRVKMDLPALPALDKVAWAAFAAWLGVWVFRKEPGDSKLITTGSKLFAGMILFNLLGTLITNRDTVSFGVVTKMGLTFRDVYSDYIYMLLWQVVPFFLGQVLFRTPDQLRTLVRGFAIAALIYFPLVMWESRMSPQLHKTFYGFFQHSWAQMVRDGAFRSIVFMSHGLSVALLMSQGATACAGLARIKQVQLPVPKMLATGLLTVGLISCVSWASIIYAVIGIPLMWMATPKMQLRVARYIAIFVLSYPMLHIFGWFNAEWVVEQFGQFSAERAQSMEFRFTNESILLEHARERFLFGWGGYGRNRVFDPDSGADLTVIDGEWIGRFGTGGFMSFAVFFLALLVPIFRASKAVKVAAPDDARILSLTAFLIAICGLDLVPNSLSHPIPLVLAGALAATSTTVLRGRSRRPAAARRIVPRGAPRAVSQRPRAR